jgi:hypothetical protein
MSQSTPVVNGGIKYINGLQMSYTSATSITVQPGRARDAFNVNDIVVGYLPNVAASQTGEAIIPPYPAGVPIVVSTALNGAGGLDVGTIADSSFYAVYAIGDSYNVNPGSVILSLSNTVPYFPMGYNLARRIGYVLTSSGGSILAFWQYGNGDVRDMWYDVGIAVPTTSGSTAYAAISLITSVPIMATEVFMKVAYTANSATDIASFLPFGSTATNGIQIFGYGVAAEQQGMLTILTEVNTTPAPAFQYKTTSGSDTLVLTTAGYRDYL